MTYPNAHKPKFGFEPIALISDDHAMVVKICHSCLENIFQHPSTDIS